MTGKNRNKNRLDEEKVKFSFGYVEFIMSIEKPNKDVKQAFRYTNLKL